VDTPLRSGIKGRVIVAEIVVLRGRSLGKSRECRERQDEDARVHGASILSQNEVMTTRPAEAFSQRFRLGRMRLFAARMSPTSETRILDVGGTPECWRLLDVRPRVTFLNVPRTRTDLAGVGEWVAGDGCCLPFADGSFDIVFSNSVIEHLATRENQERFAREVARVGRRYWVQTPDRRFPLEQHLLTPFLHWLPRTWQKRIATRWTVWSSTARVSEEERRWFVEDYLERIRLLDAHELLDLFPGAELTRERFFGLSKSLIVALSQCAHADQ
jgi:hypothetical protein